MSLFSCYLTKLTWDKFLQVEGRKQKRKSNNEIIFSFATSFQKRPRVFPLQSFTEHTTGEMIAISLSKVNLLKYWRKELC